MWQAESQSRVQVSAGAVSCRDEKSDAQSADRECENELGGRGQRRRTSSGGQHTAAAILARFATVLGERAANGTKSR